LISVCNIIAHRSCKNLRISILGNGVGILYSLLHLLLLLSMFGGHVTVPVNSPHLRKSGSRQLFSDLETTEMKLAAGAQLATAAMLPSPVLLWRLKNMDVFLLLEVFTIVYSRVHGNVLLSTQIDKMRL
nr:SPX and EXS domain-containing protein 1-like isoform X1 [Tanacetum cinerariifolium]